MALFKNFFKFFYYGPVSLRCSGLIDAAVTRVIVDPVSIFINRFIKLVLLIGEAFPAVIKSFIMPAEYLPGTSEIDFPPFSTEPLTVLTVIE